MFISIFFRTTLAETTMEKHCVVAKSEMIMLQQEVDELIEKSGIVSNHCQDNSKD